VHLKKVKMLMEVLWETKYKWSAVIYSIKTNRINNRSNSLNSLVGKSNRTLARNKIRTKMTKYRLLVSQLIHKKYSSPYCKMNSLFSKIVRLQVAISHNLSFVSCA
jgi:hypothetical protein